MKYPGTAWLAETDRDSLSSLPATCNLSLPISWEDGEVKQISAMAERCIVVEICYGERVCMSSPIDALLRGAAHVSKLDTRVH